MRWVSQTVRYVGQVTQGTVEASTKSCYVERATYYLLRAAHYFRALQRTLRKVDATCSASAGPSSPPLRPLGTRLSAWSQVRLAT